MLGQPVLRSLLSPHSLHHQTIKEISEVMEGTTSKNQSKKTESNEDIRSLQTKIEQPSQN
jgi:hypothetical protein